MSSNKPRKVLTGQAREFVIKIFEYFERENMNGGPLLPVTQVHARVKDALGINRNTVSRIVKEKYGFSGMEDNVLVTPPRTRRRKKPFVNEANAKAIREHIYENFISKNEKPTFKKLAVSLKECGVFQMGNTSLRTLLKFTGIDPVTFAEIPPEREPEKPVFIEVPVPYRIAIYPNKVKRKITDSGSSSHAVEVKEEITDSYSSEVKQEMSDSNSSIY